jgi:hypothetical protein
MPGTIQGEMALAARRGAGQTVGSATTPLATIPGPPAGAAARLEGRAVGYDSANGNAVSIARAVTVRNVGGTLTVAGSGADLLAALGDVALTGATAAFVVVGSNIEFRVTGVLTKTIAWTAEVLMWST